MTSENGVMYMPVAPAYGANNAGGYGMDGIGGIWGLLILLILFGRGGFGGNQGSYGGQPIVVNNSGAEIQRGFDQAALTTGINGIQTTLCNGFAGVNQGVSAGFAQAEIAANGRQMAEMNQNFALQTAFQNCCCENRLATAGLNTTIAQEAAATRAASAADRQMIMDKLCQLEMDGYKQAVADRDNTISQLRTQLLVANNQASQNAQTAAIIANNEAQTTALEQYLAPVPRPAYMVQNPNCCAGNFGYGGCGNYAA